MNPGLARASPAVGKEAGGRWGQEDSRKGEEAVRVYARTNRYASCTVDPRPSRAVHCPDLNACLVSSADCNAVHFGYAIPVKVLPLVDEDGRKSSATGSEVTEDLAQLVLDSEAELSPETVAYLLAHHPQLRRGTEEEGSEEEEGGLGPLVPGRRDAEAWRRRGSLGSDSRSDSSSSSGGESGGNSPPPPPPPSFAALRGMASAAAPEMPAPANPTVTRRKFSADSAGKEVGGVVKMSGQGGGGKRRSSESDKTTSSSAGEEEDVAAIAKQISDHAEAIYRAWKARGLGPSEILGCKPGDAVEASFSAAVIGPTSPVSGPSSFAGTERVPTVQRPVSVEPRQSGPSGAGPTPVRRRSEPNQSQALTNLPTPVPQPPPSVGMLLDDASGLERLVSDFVVEDKARQRQRKKELPSSIQSALQKFERKNSAPLIGSVASMSPISQPPSPSMSPHQPAIQPKPILTQPVPQQPQQQSPNSRNESQQPSGTTTWPLKVRGAKPGPEPGKKEEVVTSKLVSSETPASPTPHNVSNTAAKYATMPARKLASRGNDEQRRLADVVDREEERLIQALRTGVVLAPEDDMIDQRTSGSPAREEVRAQNSTPTTPELNSPSRAEGNRFGLRKSPGPAEGAEVKEVVPPRPKPEDPPTPKPNAAVTNGGGNRETLSGLSLVDYAKARYKAAQARLDDAKQQGPVTKETQSLVSVSETRNRFERAVNSNWSQQQWTPPSSTDLFQRRKAARGIGSAIGEVVPHPELTSQQKQHIRERSGAAAAGQASWNQNAAGGAVGAASGGTGTNPVRPFLTRGSVAERVLIFEKCPSSELLEKRKAPTVAAITASLQARTQTYSHEKDGSHLSNGSGSGAPASGVGGGPSPLRGSSQAATLGGGSAHGATSPSSATPSSPTPHITSPPQLSTLRRQTKAAVARNSPLIPRFHFPNGRPLSPQQLEAALQRVAAAFQGLPGRRASRNNFGAIAQACDCPLYWKVPIFLAAGGEKTGTVSAESFIEFWRRVLMSCHDEASRFVFLLSRFNNPAGRNWLCAEDFYPLIQDVVDTHPGLTFLKEASEFHSRYVHTVVARIFYCVNRSWSGHIAAKELRKSQLLATLRRLQEEEDINRITDFFSYEHFYVIYCKFWELDTDHDLLIDRRDLARHNDHALSSRIIERIFSGAVTRDRRAGNSGAAGASGEPNREDKMTYSEFVWFLLSEEDKTHPTAIEYWFRCMDLDGDGYLSMYELEYFYEEQLQRMEAIGIETLPFEDCLCQMLDMIHPKVPGKVSLSDLKRCKMTPIFFDTFFNLEKYLDHEQRDPFASLSAQREHDGEGRELSDWDRFAADEYELLVAEEGGSEPQDELLLDEGM
ncbi:mucin-19 isoform X2 [Hetaerina americana]|uniref:mucin-19 isoform X2 n=1 Tax=Hetaerina americana TaxID=62018 RepID=UPI003A7F4F07